MKKSIMIALIALLTMSFATYDGAVKKEADRVLGVWTSESGLARVKISKIGKKYFGKIIWLKVPIDPDTKKPKLDKLNPDEKLQKAPVKGLRMFKNFVYAGDDLWNKGTIYDPKKGKTYSCKITMKDINTLSIRGYVGISLIGRTSIWSRYTAK